MQILIGTEVGVGIYKKDRGGSILFDASGRLKFVTTVNEPDGASYFINSFTLNTHNIFGTVMVAIFAPYLFSVLIPAVARFAFGN